MRGKVISITDAMAHLSRLIRRLERGERIVIARLGQPVAELRPVRKKNKRSIRVDDPLLRVEEYSYGGPLGPITNQADNGPKNHTGEGIFFTSRMFDSFQILSGGSFFTHEHGKERDWRLEASSERQGAAVFMGLNNHTSRTARKVFDAYVSERISTSRRPWFRLTSPVTATTSSSLDRRRNGSSHG